MDGWVDGWSRARRTERPVAIDGGWRIDVGAPTESKRYVLNPVRPDRLAEIVNGTVPPHTGVKFAADPSAWLARFPLGWEIGEPAWMMLRELPTTVTRLSATGYDVEVETGAEMALVVIRATDGSVAASGRVGLGSSFVVPDQIVTEPAHRRRGLGSVVMAELEAIAVECGRRHAVLGATVDGRALYERLGWHLGSALIGAHYRPA